MGVLNAVLLLLAVSSISAKDYADNESVQLFQKYLQINTTTHNDFSKAVEFWRQRAAEVGVEFSQYEFKEGYPLLVLKWPGQDPSLGSIMLNSHMDVVPAQEEEGWSHPPFSGYLDSAGYIWGRGTQDMKSVSIQYYEALKRIRANNLTLLRDVYMTLMPDEEIGGEYGMVPFLASDVFRNMNVGFALDEGSSYDLPLGAVFYQDKVAWQLQIDCYGISAHSSMFPSTRDTAVGKCFNVMKKLYEFRDSEYAKYLAAGVTNAGAYSSMNINIIHAGTANNVIAGHAKIIIDVRPNIRLNEDVFDAQVRQWIAESGDNITLTYIIKSRQSPATDISANNPYWVAFASTLQQMNYPILTIVPPGSTDARFVRSAGIPALGFSPMISTELLAHSVDERLLVTTFLTGIDIYEKIIPNISNIPGDLTSAHPSDYIIETTS